MCAMKSRELPTCRCNFRLDIDDVGITIDLQLGTVLSTVPVFFSVSSILAAQA